MKAKEWLNVIKQSNNYNPSMTKLIEMYGELLLEEYILNNGMGNYITICDNCKTKLIK